MTDDEFICAFESCTLQRSEWTHGAHVRMAWIYLSRMSDFESALNRIRKGIQRLNASYGSGPDKYHDTITIAYAALIKERIERDVGASTWPGFCAAYPELLDWSSPLPLRHYTRERLFSRAAYDAYVEPDLDPLPLPIGPAME